jgi:riboflavin transporter FmnP
LIICFIIAVILLLILNKYLFKPIFEKKGSVPPNHSTRVMCSVEAKDKIPFQDSTVVVSECPYPEIEWSGVRVPLTNG